MIVFNDGWAIRTVGDHVFIKRHEKPGEIVIKAGAEGFEIDACPDGMEVEPEGTMGIFYTDLEEAAA